MQTYEFKAKINADGKLEIPEIFLKDLPDNSVVNVVVVVEANQTNEPLEPAIESFRRGWHDAMTGKTIPVSQLWD